MRKVERSGLICCAVLTALAAPFSSARAQQPKHPPAKQTHIRVSKKTTHITTPLDAEGYVDYLAAANLRQARGVTPDNNWEVAARRVLGIGDVPEAMRGEYFRRLGIPVPPAEGDYLLDLVTFAKGAGVAESDERLVEIYSRVTDRPWRTADEPVAARWLRASAKHLDALVEGTRRERNYTPYVLLPSDEEETPVPAMIVLPLPAVQEQRKVARVLTSRALLRIGEGDLKGARSDLLACHRQARLLAQGKVTLVHALVGMAIEGMACSADQHLLNSPQLTAAECRAHLGDLAALPPLPNMADHIDVAERHIGLDCVQFLARHEEKNVSELINVIQSLTGGPAPNDGTTYVSLVQDIRAIVDWNATMEVLNEHYDLIADAAREPALAKRDAKLAAVEARLNKLKAGVGAAIAAGAAQGGPKGMGKFVGHVLSVLLLPAVPASIDAHLVSVAKLEATRAAYAVRLHQLSTGKRPESIEAVKPHLGRVPLDPFTEKPLLLKWSGGVFVVYSVGRNRTDDNGDDEEARDGADDIGARGPE